MSLCTQTDDYMSARSNRNSIIDIISGVFILRMLYTHTCMFAEYSSHTYIFSMTSMFLMWFFFKGGLYSKENINFHCILKNTFKKMLLPFITLTIIAILCDSALYFIDTINGGGYYTENEIIRTLGSFVLNGSAHGNMPIWFLFSYFFVRVVYALQITKVKNLHPYVPILICLLVPFGLHFLTFRYPYYFANIFLGTFGYYAGALYKKYIDYRLVGFVSVLIYLGIFLFDECSLDIRTNTLYSGQYLVWSIWSLSSCVFYFTVLRYLKFLTIVLEKLGLAWIGSISMSVLAFHWPILLFADFVNKSYLSIPLGYALTYYLFVVAVFTIPIHYIVKNTKIRFIIGL